MEVGGHGAVEAAREEKEEQGAGAHGGERRRPSAFVAHTESKREERRSVRERVSCERKNVGGGQ